jgi:hypothetical protein
MQSDVIDQDDHGERRDARDVRPQKPPAVRMGVINLHSAFFGDGFRVACVRRPNPQRRGFSAVAPPPDHLKSGHLRKLPDRFAAPETLPTDLRT